MSDVGTDAGIGGPPPFLRVGPVDAATPLVLAVPHAGRHYPAALDTLRAVSRHVLEELEDRYADRLVAEAVRGGAVAIVATFARAWIDLNRGAEDGIGAGGSARARAGLGLIPDRLGGRPLWRQEPDAADGAVRLDRVHAPYHAAIAAALDAARARHSFAVLIDCHSMPPLRRGDTAPQIVLGDRHGTSAGPRIAAAACSPAPSESGSRPVIVPNCTSASRYEPYLLACR